MPEKVLRRTIRLKTSFVAVGLFTGIIGLSGCGSSFSAFPSNGSTGVSWAASREASVNAAGGGYRVFHSTQSGFDPAGAPYVDVVNAGSATATANSVQLTGLPESTNYVKVESFGVDAAGVKHFSAPSQQISFKASVAATTAAKATRGLASRSEVMSSVALAPASVSVPSRGIAAGKHALTPQQMSYDLDRAEYVKDEVLVTYKAGSAASEQAGASRAIGARTVQKLSSARLRATPTARLQLASVMPLRSAIEALKRDPRVASAQPNFIYHQYATPNDPKFLTQWDLSNTGQTVVSAGADALDTVDHANPGTSGSDMNIQAAWDVITDCSSHVVAVIDSGVDFDHADLATNMWVNSSYPNHGTDFVDLAGDGKGMEGHGTHVAGTIGAIGNNGVGTTGVCWKAQIMNVRVLGNDGSGTTANVVSGIDFARENGASIINMSLGGGGYDATLDTAVKAASDAGMVVAVAAGNDTADNDSTDDYPCNFPYSGVICVAALNQRNALADYSNYGATTVDVGAPGTNVTSLWNGSVASATVNLSSFTTAAGWGTSVHPDYSIPILSTPSNWNGTLTYPTGSTAGAFFSAVFPSATYLTLDYFAQWSLSSGDNVTLKYKTGITTTPFVAGATASKTYTDDSGGGYEFDQADITGCAGQTCSVGFQLNSGNVANTGIWLAQMEYSALTTNNVSYDTISGTSMATPHVAGLAALVWSVNPGYTAVDVINAIKSSGTALSALAGATSSGRAINAAAAVTYLAPPQSLSIQ